MDSNTFAAAQLHGAVELIVGISWPAVVLILAITFRSQVVGLLARLSRLKVFGLAADFDTKLAEVAATLATTTTPATAGRAAGTRAAHNATATVRESVTARLATSRGRSRCSR